MDKKEELTRRLTRAAEAAEQVRVHVVSQHIDGQWAAVAHQLARLTSRLIQPGQGTDWPLCQLPAIYGGPDLCNEVAIAQITYSFGREHLAQAAVGAAPVYLCAIHNPTYLQGS